MFCFLSQVVLARKPVILVPGLGASTLWMQTSSSQYKWYCPKNVDGVVWLNDKYVIPPIFNCILHWIQQKYDPKTQCPTNNEDVLHADTVGFGTLAGITNVDTFTKYNWSFVPYYKNLIKKFTDNGYTEGVDLFGAPNDWRKGIACQHEFNEQFRALIEKIYSQTGQKVVILGHSFGCFISHYFLTYYMEDAWVKKYIDHSVYLAPSFAGSGKALRISWTKTYRKFIEWTDEDFKATVETLGCLHTHFHNWDLYKNQHIIIGPDGTPYGPEHLQKLLIQHNKISAENAKLMNLQVPYLSMPIPSPRVKTYIFYNDQISTPFGFKVKDWSSDSVEDITAGGDGSVIGEGVARFCHQHKDMTECFNLNDQTPSTGEHLKMLLQDKYVEQYFQYSQK